MGKIAAIATEFAGRNLGSYIGNKIDNRFKTNKFKQLGSDIGSAAGAVAGHAIPYFKKGGRVKGKHGQPVKIVAHAGEYVLPIGVQPTKFQKREVKLKQAFL
jgi:hypothetical protein